MPNEMHELSDELAAAVSRAENLIQKGQTQVERTRRRIQETQLVIGFHRSIHRKREKTEEAVSSRLNPVTGARSSPAFRKVL